MDTLQRYATDLTDCQWAHVAGLIPEPKKGGRPTKYERRDVATAVMFVTRGRRSWRSLAGDLPPWRVPLVARVDRLEVRWPSGQVER
jgi:putative transposase